MNRFTVSACFLLLACTTALGAEKYEYATLHVMMQVHVGGAKDYVDLRCSLKEKSRYLIAKDEVNLKGPKPRDVATVRMSLLLEIMVKLGRKVDDFKDAKNLDETDMLNVLGDFGWELVSYTHLQVATDGLVSEKWLFKRTVATPEAP